MKFVFDWISNVVGFVAALPRSVRIPLASDKKDRQPVIFLIYGRRFYCVW